MPNIPDVNFNKIPNEGVKFNQNEYYESNFDKINEQIVPKVNELDDKVNIDIPSQLEETVKSVNNVLPDVNGNVEIEVGEGLPEWITPTLLNGATGSLMYCLDSFGFISFKGNLTLNGNSNFLAFPFDYRPSDNRFSIVPDTSLSINKRVAYYSVSNVISIGTTTSGTWFFDNVRWAL